MSYTALYRKFRPQRFSDVKGQDHIVTTLKNQIKAGRIGHAYLFCGTRGTGKTTVAKIFARAVNCESPIDGSPCGECAACRAIAAGTSMNVVEIDAASNNGVDNIRQIREEVEYRPAEGRYKVYIIDEVHMLSKGAFNALLKTLEEPPSYVIFILATTEAHAIPVTILSRCQRYDFRHISVDTIAARLAELMEKEQVVAEERAIRYVARRGDGSMRDALSLLDQCISFYLGEELTYEKVLKTLGAADTEVFSRLLRQVISQDVPGAIGTLDGVIADGREIGQFVTDFTWYLRNLLLMQSADGMEDVLDISEENLSALREEAKMTDPAALMRYIRIFSELGSQMRHASQKRVLAEVAIIKLCRPEMEEDYSSLADRVGRLEKKLEQGYIAPDAKAGAFGAGASGASGTPASGTGASGAPSAGLGAAGTAAPLPAAIPDDVREAVSKWKDICGRLKFAARPYLKQARCSLGENGELLLVFSDQTAYEYADGNASGCQDALRQAIREQIGREVEIRVRYAPKDAGSGEADYPDLKELIKADIEEED